MMKITRAVTSDSLDGQPWPPTERNVLWRLLQRDDGWSHWRAIELAESDRCHGLCNSAVAATATKGAHYDER